MFFNQKNLKQKKRNGLKKQKKSIMFDKYKERIKYKQNQKNVYILKLSYKNTRGVFL